MRHWVLSFPYPLRFPFAARPDVMGRVLGTACRAIATHLIGEAGLTRAEAEAGAVSLVRRFGSAGG